MADCGGCSVGIEGPLSGLITQIWKRTISWCAALDRIRPRKRPLAEQRRPPILAAFLFALCIISRLYGTLLLRRGECLWLSGSNPARGAARRTNEINNLEWLPFVDAYRTLCIAPDRNLRASFERIAAVCGAP